jgi:hypothetical protein
LTTYAYTCTQIAEIQDSTIAKLQKIEAAYEMAKASEEKKAETELHKVVEHLCKSTG